MDNSNEQLFDGIGRLRQNNNKNRSKAASVQPTEETVTISMKEYRELLSQDGKCANTINQIIRKSKAASISASGVNQVQIIHDFITKGF